MEIREAMLPPQEDALHKERVWEKENKFYTKPNSISDKILSLEQWYCFEHVDCWWGRSQVDSRDPLLHLDITIVRYDNRPILVIECLADLIVWLIDTTENVASTCCYISSPDLTPVPPSSIYQLISCVFIQHTCFAIYFIIWLIHPVFSVIHL